MTEEKVLNKGIEGEITDKELDQVAGGGWEDIIKTGVEIFKGVLGGGSKKSEGTTEVQTPLITQEGNNNKGFNESLNKNKGKISIG
ncbi:MAG: hypothetical protein ACI3ZR_04115 [bacterium]